MTTRATSLTISIPSKPDYSYDIIIGENILENVNDFLIKYTGAKKFLVVTNHTVYNLYKHKLKINNSEYVILDDGEEYKNYNSLKKIYDAAVEAKLERSDYIIAFGGGVVGDIAGYAAATYMRGINFIQIPTTLLAQVDSAVGGKVGINHEKGKNLIGAFYQPKLVISDISLLKTLDKRQLKSGLAEVLKYAFIEKSCDCPLYHRFYDFLLANVEKIYELDPDTMIQLINICCTLKAHVVSRDEREAGIRAILNFGHTFAHAIENLTDYKRYTHGEAVAIGMKMAFKASYIMKMIDENYYMAANELIDKYGLVGEIPQFSSAKFIEAMSHDKKVDAYKIRFILSSGDFMVKMVKDVTYDIICKSIA